MKGTTAMSEHVVTLNWTLQTESFDYEAYNRTHSIDFEGHNRLCASAAPDFHGDPSCVNPEQSFVAALASCHMLTFLAIASKKKYVVTSYTDNAVGVLGKNAEGKIAITRINLTPAVTFASGKAPDQDTFHLLHDRAHKGCFIANSVASCVKVAVEGTFTVDV
ncbi:MAG: OsmC family protein [Chitinispirillaceae bacterium]|nr:OsmC family protein [Chitinispirillaceae bacterium]